MSAYGCCTARCDGRAGGNKTAVSGALESVAIENEGIGRGDGGKIVRYAVFDHLARVGVVDYVVVDCRGGSWDEIVGSKFQAAVGHLQELVVGEKRRCRECGGRGSVC